MVARVDAVAIRPIEYHVSCRDAERGRVVRVGYQYVVQTAARRVRWADGDCGALRLREIGGKGIADVARQTSKQGVTPRQWSVQIATDNGGQPGFVEPRVL
jgi:hypothetical protein